MNLDFNKPPKGYAPPSEWNGKKVVHVMQAVIADDDQEASYKCILADNTTALIPLSKFVKEKE